MAGTVSRKARRRQARSLLLQLHGQVQSALLLGSLLVLAVTGLSQKFDSLGPSQWLMDSVGGLETLRLIHHVAGGALLFASFYHLVLVLYSVLILKVLAPLEMIPNAKDFRDALHMAFYFLGLRQRRVTFERPSYLQKFDYWVIVWGLTVMGLSGLILLFPVHVVRFLPGEAVVAALRMHSDTAVLILAWVLLVHLIYAGLSPAVFPRLEERAPASSELSRPEAPPAVAPEPAVGATAIASTNCPADEPSGGAAQAEAGAIHSGEERASRESELGP